MLEKKTKNKKDKCFPSPLRGTEPAPSSVLNTGFRGWKPLWVSKRPRSALSVWLSSTQERFQPLELELGGPSGGLLGFRAGWGHPTTTRTSFRFCPGVSLPGCPSKMPAFLAGQSCRSPGTPLRGRLSSHSPHREGGEEGGLQGGPEALHCPETGRGTPAGQMEATCYGSLGWKASRELVTARGLCARPLQAPAKWLLTIASDGFGR